MMKTSKVPSHYCKNNSAIFTLFSRIIITVLLLLTLFIPDIDISAAPVMLNDSISEYSLNQSCRYFIDYSSQYTISDIMKKETTDRFITPEAGDLNIGFSQSTCWIIFDLSNKSEKRTQWLIELAYPVIDTFDLFYKDDYEKTVKQPGGDTLPFNSRTYRHHNLVHLIHLEPGSVKRYYIKIKSNNSIVIPLKLWTPEKLAHKSYHDQLYLGLFFGILLIMILYNLVLFFSIHERIYLYYFLTIVFASLYFMCILGHASMYFWPDSAWWADLAPIISLTTSVLFMGLFTTTYLKTEIYAPILNRFFLILFILLSFLLPASFFINRHTSSILVSLLALTTVTLSLATAIYILVKGYRPARYYLYAWSIFLLAAIFHGLRAFGFITHYFSILTMVQIGFVASMVFFSIGLAYRINLERELKEEAMEDSFKAMALLEESENKFRQISEQSELLILIMQDGMIKYANEACARLYETSLDKIYQWTFEKLKNIIHPDDFEYVTTQYRKKIDGDSNYNSHYQYRAVTLKGRTIWVDNYSRPIQLGNRPALLVTQLDITEQKEAQEIMKRSREELEKEVEERTSELSEAYKSLQESEELFRALTENSSDITIIINSDIKLLYISPSINHYGYDPRVLKGSDLSEMIHPDDITTLENAVARAGSDPCTPVIIDEMRMKNSMGNWFHVESTVKDMTDTNVVKGIVINCCDITEKKKAELEQLKASKIESLAVFSGGIAHDFNNLLTAVIGNISVARNMEHGSTELSDILMEAEKASFQARSLTQQLLTFSRGGEPIKKVVSLTPLIRENAEFALSGSNIICNFSIPHDIWNVEVDEGQISQVVHNLVLNAREAMDGGAITISGENVTIDTDSDHLKKGDYVLITITDQGHGINEENMPNIFDPYFTTKEDGNGLGLSISYSIIKKHGGHIQVRPDCGSGSSFQFYLKSTEQVNESTLKQVTPKTFHGERILIMDDDEQVLKAARRMLSHIGFNVTCSTHGEETIVLYREAFHSSKPFHAVIMDLTVPGCMGGKEAIELLKDIDPDVKSIVSSGYSNDPVMANYKDYGFSGVVPKPYRIEDISAVLSELL
jgi:PAS domain S-box-containing protein